MGRNRRNVRNGKKWINVKKQKKWKEMVEMES